MPSSKNLAKIKSQPPRPAQAELQDIQDAKLLIVLHKSYPNFNFKAGKDFYFHPPTTTIYYLPNHPDFKILILHELAHTLLNHHHYQLDIELVKIEVAAWEKTAQLCQKYAIKWDKNFAEAKLDSYRDWLHRRALCPSCGLSAYQKNDLSYHCPSCLKTWQSRVRKH